MKYHVHMFEERCHKYLVEADSLDDAYAKATATNIADLNEVSVTNTGEFSGPVLVDALLPDGETDYDHTKWFD